MINRTFRHDIYKCLGFGIAQSKNRPWVSWPQRTSKGQWPSGVLGDHIHLHMAPNGEHYESSYAEPRCSSGSALKTSVHEQQVASTACQRMACDIPLHGEAWRDPCSCDCSQMDEICQAAFCDHWPISATTVHWRWRTAAALAETTVFGVSSGSHVQFSGTMSRSPHLVLISCKNEF